MKKKTHLVGLGLLLGVAAGLLACGCSTVNSTTLTQGAIQSSRKATGFVPAEGGSKGTLGTIQVRAFTESRARNCQESHNLWLAYIPVACANTYWERPNWMLWNSIRSVYKPVGLDMAEALCTELEETGLFQRVLKPDEQGEADWLVDGDVQELKYSMYPHLCGGSIFLAPFLGALGLPLGNWEIDQRVCVKVKASVDQSLLLEKTTATQARGVMAAYYGGNPMQFGYPYEQNMRPVVADLLSALPQKLAAAQKTLPAVAVAKPSAPTPSAPDMLVPPPNLLVPHVPVRAGVCWAVVIGVSSYKDSRIPALRYAVNDARTFSQWLVSPQGGRYAPSNVKLLLDADATANNIRQALFDWLQQAVAEDQVTIYFAGHGSPDSPDSTANLFLLPYDTDYSHISATAFPMWDVETALKRYIRAKRVIVIADACHAAGVGEGFDVARRSGRGMKVNPIDAGLENLATLGEGTCVISASSGSQTSQEGGQWGGGHGVFTHFLLQGLSGEADYPRTGQVTLGKLTQYVSEQVRRATRNAQTPIVSGRFDPGWTLAK
jgi:hypothetical protein